MLYEGWQEGRTCGPVAVNPSRLRQAFCGGHKVVGGALVGGELVGGELVGGALVVKCLVARSWRDLGACWWRIGWWRVDGVFSAGQGLERTAALTSAYSSSAVPPGRRPALPSASAEPTHSSVLLACRALTSTDQCLS